MWCAIHTRTHSYRLSDIQFAALIIQIVELAQKYNQGFTLRSFNIYYCDKFEEDGNFHAKIDETSRSF